MINSFYTCFYPFYFSKFKISVQAEELLTIPDFKGSTIHGAFGHSLKNIVCPFKHRQCKSDCIFFNDGQCLYQYIFKTRVPQTEEFKNDKTIRNRKGEQPSPFIICTVPEHKTQYQPGERFSFDIVLIGKVEKYFSYIVYALDNMCGAGIGKGKGKCLLLSVHAIDINKKEHLLYDHETQTLKPEKISITLKDLVRQRSCPDIGSSTSMTFKFNTRLEINTKGKFPDINFDILFRRLLARVATTAKLHCGLDCSSIDFKKLSHASGTVATISSSLSYERAQRYSSRQKCRHSFGGLIGEITFACKDWSPFWPILLLGEQIHVGKKTSFGFGDYTIKVNK